MKTRVSIPTLFLVALAGPALAVDGAREISQVCAVNGGCFPGDAGGFPVTISQAGSYVLTTDLELSNALNGIQITTSDVSIDLNGFTVRGTGDACSGSGILATGTSRVSVRNGRVTEFEIGVYLGEESRVERVAVLGYNAAGIRVLGGGAVERCDVMESGQSCVAGETGIIVSGIATSNRVSALLLGISGGGVIRGNSINTNGDGIQAAEAQVSGNQVRAEDFGIIASDSVVRGNSIVLGGGCNGAGISATESQITDNKVTGGCDGLSLDANSGYSNNTIVATPAVSGGVDQGGNACNGSTSC